MKSLLILLFCASIVLALPVENEVDTLPDYVISGKDLSADLVVNDDAVKNNKDSENVVVVKDEKDPNDDAEVISEEEKKKNGDVGVEEEGKEQKREVPIDEKKEDKESEDKTAKVELENSNAENESEDQISSDSDPFKSNQEVPDNAKQEDDESQPINTEADNVSLPLDSAAVKQEVPTDVKQEDKETEDQIISTETENTEADNVSPPLDSAAVKQEVPTDAKQEDKETEDQITLTEPENTNSDNIISVNQDKVAVDTEEKEDNQSEDQKNDLENSNQQTPDVSLLPTNTNADNVISPEDNQDQEVPVEDQTSLQDSLDLQNSNQQKPADSSLPPEQPEVPMFNFDDYIIDMPSKTTLDEDIFPEIPLLDSFNPEQGVPVEQSENINEEDHSQPESENSNDEKLLLKEPHVSKINFDDYIFEMAEEDLDEKPKDDVQDLLLNLHKSPMEEQGLSNYPQQHQPTVNITSIIKFRIYERPHVTKVYGTNSPIRNMINPLLLLLFPNLRETAYSQIPI